MSCHCIDTYTNGYGHKVCSDCGRVIEPETTASDSTETPKRMKPLDKLEQMMFEAMVGRPWVDCKKQWFGPKEDFDLCEQNARDTAQVAKDLARRAHDHGSENAYLDFRDFLTSEGITE